MCGDGTTNILAGEDCDPGEETAICDADCTWSTCGDGYINVADGETCEEGAVDTATCDNDCTEPMCGDYNFNPEVGEECDTAGDSSSCNSDCSLPRCGDGYLNAEAGEECETPVESATCDGDCTFPVCGDGFVNTVVGETCDSTFGCLADCSQCGGVELVFAEDFSDNAAGWTLGPEWEIGPTVYYEGAYMSGGDPANDHSPSTDNGVAGMVLGGETTIELHAFSWLTSPVIDLDGESAVTLEYWRWLNSDYEPWISSAVEVFDGSDWIAIWEIGELDEALADMSWTYQSFDVSEFANPEFRVRIGHAVNNNLSLQERGGWNVDDLRVLTGQCD